MMNIEEIEKIYGPQYSGDNSFTRAARLLQSYHRVAMCELAGEKKTSGKNLNGSKYNEYGNLLIHGQQTGKNFILRETWAYAKNRVINKGRNETIDAERLFNNMLSSMPMTFNLFHPLMLIQKSNPEALNCMIKSAFPSMPIDKVTEIRIEFIPEPIKDYTQDKSAMDAAVEFMDTSQNHYIIAFEVKYTDKLGKNVASDNEKKFHVALKSGIFTDPGLMTIKRGCTQIYRNILLTESYRMVKSFKDSYSVILAPKGNPTTQNEISRVLQDIKPEFHYKVIKYHLEDFIKAIGVSCPGEYSNWLDNFWQRYLNFNLIQELL